MTQYINKQTMQLMSDSDIRREFPDIMFPEPIEAHHIDELGIAVLNELPIPETPYGSTVQVGIPYEEDGQYYVGWIIVPPTAGFWKSEIADRRWIEENGGITVGGIRIDTDDRSKLLINGAALEALMDPNYVLQWKTENGFIEMNAEQVKVVASAVRAHVQACFNREEQLASALVQGTFTPEMLDEGWPAYDVEEV